GARGWEKEGAPPPAHGEHGRDREPDQSLATDPRQTFEDRVQPPDPVVDGPALELPVVAHRPAWPMSCGGGKPARSEWEVPPSLWRRGLVGETGVSPTGASDGQAGSSCLACSISCCGSKGFPTKPCAPRAVASCADRSLTLPLNITTGIAPTPCRSCTRRSISHPSTSGIITSSRIRSGETSSSTPSPS